MAVALPRLLTGAEWGFSEAEVNVETHCAVDAMSPTNQRLLVTVSFYQEVRQAVQ